MRLAAWFGQFVFWRVAKARVSEFCVNEE